VPTYILRADGTAWSRRFQDRLKAFSDDLKRYLQKKLEIIRNFDYLV
jgi:hypothetical protein